MRPRRSPECRPPRGFTLVEVLVVLALIALVTAMAAGAFTGGLDGMRLRSAARSLAADLRMAQALAVATGKPQEVVVQPAAGRWMGPRGRHGQMPQAVAMDFIGAREVQPAKGQGAVRFFPDGGATGGRVRLRQREAVWEVDVSWLTGEVSLRSPGEAP